VKVSSNFFELINTSREIKGRAVLRR